MCQNTSSYLSMIDLHTHFHFQPFSAKTKAANPIEGKTKGINTEAFSI